MEDGRVIVDDSPLPEVRAAGAQTHFGHAGEVIVLREEAEVAGGAAVTTGEGDEEGETDGEK